MLFSPSQVHPLLDWKPQYRACVMTAVSPWTACIPHSCCWLYLPVGALLVSTVLKVFSPHLNVLHLLVFLHRRPVLGHRETVWLGVVSPSQTLRLTCSFFVISLSTFGMIVNWVLQPHEKAQVRWAYIDWDGNDGYSPTYYTLTASTCSSQWPAWILLAQPHITMLSDHNEKPHLLAQDPKLGLSCPPSSVHQEGVEYVPFPASLWGVLFTPGTPSTVFLLFV
jgi:hypothetical protein